MLLTSAIRTIGRSNAAAPLFKQQLSRLNHLTPISSYHFHQKRNDEKFRKTGLLVANYSFGNQINLKSAIHSHSSLYLKYSNLLDQKVNENEKKIGGIDNAPVDDKPAEQNLESSLEEVQKLGLFARFKRMAKDYWYVLIPVHVATSAVWLGAFYYTSKSGVDIVGILEYYNFSDTIIRPLRDSHLGHIAVAYFLYKIATPARYTVTLGGTTFAIKFLSQRGIIKPMPTKDQLVQIYKDKKVDLHQKVADKKQSFQDTKQALQDKYMKKE